MRKVKGKKEMSASTMSVERKKKKNHPAGNRCLKTAAMIVGGKGMVLRLEGETGIAALWARCH